MSNTTVTKKSSIITSILLFLTAVGAVIYGYYQIGYQRNVAEVPEKEIEQPEYVVETEQEKPANFSEAKDVYERSELFIFDNTFTALYSDSERSFTKVHSSLDRYDFLVSSLIIEKNITSAVISNDESFIAYSTEKKSKDIRAGVYIANINKTEISLIKEALEGTQFSDVKISPSGRYISFIEKNGEANHSLIIHDREKQAIKRIESEVAISSINEYSWTSDEKILMLVSSEDKKQVLFSESINQFHKLRPLAENIFDQYQDIISIKKSPTSVFFSALVSKNEEEENKSYLLILKPEPDVQIIEKEIPDNAVVDSIFWGQKNEDLIFGGDDQYFFASQDSDFEIEKNEEFSGKGDLIKIENNNRIFKKQFESKKEKVEQISIFNDEGKEIFTSDIFSRVFLLVVK